MAARVAQAQAQLRGSLKDVHLEDEEGVSLAWFGIGIALLANSFNAISLNIQKLAHNQNEALGPEKRVPYYRMPLWWLGMAMNGLGEVGNLIAYGYAEATVVTPLGAISVIWSAVIATLFLKERFKLSQGLGIVAIIGGVVLMVVSKGAEPVIEPTVAEAVELYFGTFQASIYTLVVAVSTFLLWAASGAYGSKYVIVYCSLSSLIASWTVLGSKALMAWLRISLERGDDQFFAFPEGIVSWGCLLLVVLCVVWSVHFLQQGMRFHDNNQVIPLQYATFTLSCIIGASIIYREFETASLADMGLFFLGCLMAMGGVRLISQSRVPESDVTKEANLSSESLGHAALVQMDVLATAHVEGSKFGSQSELDEETGDSTISA